MFGSCDIEIPVKSIFSLLISEVLNPFYLFQVFLIKTQSIIDIQYNYLDA